MFYRVNWLWSRAGGISGVNTQHVSDALPWDDGGGNMALVASTVDAKLTAAFRALLGTPYTLDGITVVTVADPNVPTQVPTSVEVPLALAGTRALADNNLPPRIGGLIAWKTGFTPRYARGRMFTPPLEDSSLFVADLIASGSNMITAMTSFANLVLDGNRLGPGADFGGAWDTEVLSFVVFSPTRLQQNLAPAAFGISAWSNSRKAAYLSSRDS